MSGDHRHSTSRDDGHAHDHAHGHSHDHAHGHYHDPGGDDHLHDIEYTPVEENPIWLEDNVVLRSVGIDIGSAGTQIVFSTLTLRRFGEDLTSRYVIVDRDTTYLSRHALTPFIDEETIDAVALGHIIDEAYAAAGQHPEQVDTGIVILTGEALRRANSERIADIVAERAGDLVCASAGHHMEARLAAFGSGAVRMSHEDRSRLLNVDIGGGTTKFSLIDKGTVIATAALGVGGRLQVNAGDEIVRIADQGRLLAGMAGFDWQLGATVSSEELDAVAEVMAELVLAAAQGPPYDPELAALFLTDPLPAVGSLDGILFSGGVSEYLYGRETRDFGDLGRRLGLTLARRIEGGGALSGPLLSPVEAIRATVLGASEYSVQLSGRTCWLTGAETLLPRRNVPVVKPKLDQSELSTPERVAQAITAALADHDSHSPDLPAALAFEWSGAPDYARLRSFSEGIADVLRRRSMGTYIVIDSDIAQTLGRILDQELGVVTPFVVLDGLRLLDFDFIDIGQVRRPSMTVPVTIKSLVFTSSVDE